MPHQKSLAKSTVFPHHNIHKYTIASNSKMHNQIDHVLRNKRQHSSIVDVQSFWEANYITDNDLWLQKLKTVCQ